MTALSEPPQPPVDITAVPVASSSDAAVCEVATAADHVPSVAVSSAVSSLFVLTPMPSAAPCRRRIAPRGPAGRRRRPPPIAPLLVAPTLGMLPVCATEAVATAYALVPASPVSSAATTPTSATRRSRPAPTSSPATAGTARPTTTHRIHANDSADEASRMKLHAAVAATISASVPRASSAARRAHSACAPTPTSAAIPGARATV